LAHGSAPRHARARRPPADRALAPPLPAGLRSHAGARYDLFVGDTPKSAFEIAMERLRAEDREAGVVETPLTDAQKKEIADARQLCSSQIAQLEILLKDALWKAAEAEASARLEEEFQTDRRRCEEDRDRAIAGIRSGKSA